MIHDAPVMPNPRRLGVLAFGLWMAMVLGCGPPPRPPGGGGDDDDTPGLPDARVPGAADAAQPGTPDARPPTDGGAVVDATTTTPDAKAGGSLPPDLELPAANGQVCDQYGGMTGECPSGQVCRPYSTTEGRCESCGPCGNLNAHCNYTDECDILFTCYQGRCVGYCTLGTSECGSPADCVDIGNATRGICKPY
jgi:hypothetical protein